ncbi:MAG: peptidylprolyl isomerase [Owenweeksia sp.]
MLSIKKNLKRIDKMKEYLVALTIILGTAAMAQPQLVDGVVAVVGKNIVLKSNVDSQFKNLKDQGLTENESEKCRIFEELLFEKLLLHQAEIDSIEVSPEEVDLAIERRINVFVQQIGSRQKLEQYYKKSIVEIKEEMQPYVHDQMVAQKMLREITKDIEITPTEVRTFYNAIPEDSLPLINSQVEYAQIIKYPTVSKEAKQEAIDRLNDLRQRIEDGSSFSTMAVLYSEDPGSAKNGGEYEGIKRGQFVKEFEAVAFNLKAGEISEPFATEYGYHIVQLQKRRGEELDLRHILIKPKVSQENLQKAQTMLDSVRMLILNKEMTFEEAAEKFSDDENSKLNGGMVMNPQSSDTRWETGQLDKTVFYAVENLEAGRISEPLFFRTPDKKEGFRLIKLINQTEPHRADLKTDYQIIQSVARQEKENKATQKWIDEKLKTTYVRVNNEYFNCNFERNWIKRSSQYVE